MKTLRFAAFLIYRYYSKGPNSNIAYFRTLLMLSMLVVIHLMQCMAIFDFRNILPQGPKSEFSTWLSMALFGAPIVLFLRILVSEKEIKAAYYGEEQIRRGNRWRIAYIIASVCLVIALAFVHKPSSLT